MSLESLTLTSSFDEVAEGIYSECKLRNYSREETVAVTSTGIQESGLRMVKHRIFDWFCYFQQDASYVNRNSPAGCIRGFLDRLDAKRRSPGASPDIWRNIFWLQQRPSDSSADAAFNHPKARRAYYDEIRRHIDQANQLYDRFTGGHMPWKGDPVWLPDVLRDAGVPVQVAPDALNRGHGDMLDIWGVVDHHTGNDNASWQSIAFHPELGLASQLHLSYQGLVTFCGVGIAWHAGNGSWPGLGTNNANPRTIGVEAANDGGGAPGRPHRLDWPAVQYDNYVKLNAAILSFLKYGSDRSIGHKEWAGAAQGKWDPGGIDMNIFRKDIQSLLSIPVGPRLNAIDEQAKAATWLGKRITTGEERTADGNGRFARFENGYVYWSPDTGAWAIPTHLFETYAELGWEAGALGYPVAPHEVVEGGDVQAFQRGILFRKYGEAGHFVTGLIGNRFRILSWERGALGWPKSNEIKQGGMFYQQFEAGRIAWSPDGTIVIKNDGSFI